MLDIRDIEYTSDGRAVVNTVGSRRFRTVTKSVKDGYNTATVEFLEVRKFLWFLIQRLIFISCCNKIQNFIYLSVS